MGTQAVCGQLAQSEGRVDYRNSASGSDEFGCYLRLSLCLCSDAVAEVLFGGVYPQRIACGNRFQNWALCTAECCGQERQPIGSQRRSNAAEGGHRGKHICADRDGSAVGRPAACMAAGAVQQRRTPCALRPLDLSRPDFPRLLKTGPAWRLGSVHCGLARRHSQGCGPHSRKKRGAATQRARACHGAQIQSKKPLRWHRFPADPNAKAKNARQVADFEASSHCGAKPHPHHGRYRNRQEYPDPKNLVADRGARRDGHHLRSRTRLHARVLLTRPWRRDSESSGCQNALLESRRGIEARRRGADISCVPLPRPAQRESVLCRRPTENLRASSDVPALSARLGLLDVPRRRNRPESERHRICGDDRPAGTGATKWRAGVPEHDRRHSEAASLRKRNYGALERGGVVETEEGLALSDQHTGNAQTAHLTNELVARYACIAVDESRAVEYSKGLVRFGRTGQLATVAATAYGHHGKPQVEQSRNARISGPQPA